MSVTLPLSFHTHFLTAGSAGCSINWTNAGNLHTSNHTGMQTSIVCQRKEKWVLNLCRFSVAWDNLLGTYWSVVKALRGRFRTCPSIKICKSNLSNLISYHLCGCLGKSESRAGCSDTSSEEPLSFPQLVAQGFLKVGLVFCIQKLWWIFFLT